MVCSFSFRGIYFNKFKPYQILFYFVGFFRNFVLLAFLNALSSMPRTQATAAMVIEVGASMPHNLMSALSSP
jgi:hypothetical protein